MGFARLSRRRMSALLISREERAYHVLKVCEYAARGLVADLTDVEDASMPLLTGCFETFASKVRYLMPRASAQWKPEFDAALSTSHSMRVERIELPRKTALSGVVGKCMACGRTETNCRYAIDLAGSLDPKQWLKGPGEVAEQYSAFKEDYAAALQPGLVAECTRAKRMPEIDRGCFVVGQTCLRKAKLKYLLQSMLLDACYTCERDVEELVAEGVEGAGLSSDTLYTLSPEKCAEFVKTQDMIELAIADEKRPVPEVAVDRDFWDIIDECRNSAADGDEDKFNRIIRERAIETLRVLRPHQGRETDDVGSSEDDVDDDSEYEEVVHSRRKRARACVIRDESDEDSTRDGTSGPVTRSGTSRVSSRPSRASVSASAAEGGPSNAAPGAGNSSSANGQNGLLVGSRGKSTAASVSDMVGRQRAAGLLPSRNEALVQLMELQARLTRNFNHRDAAVCTNAILTLQELMQRVEDLAHTAAI